MIPEKYEIDLHISGYNSLKGSLKCHTFFDLLPFELQ